MCVRRWSLEHQVTVTYFSGCYRDSRGIPQSPNCCSSYNLWGKMGESEMDDDRSMVKEVEGMWNFGRREMSHYLSEGISVCVVMVMVLIVLVGVVVLMVVVGVMF